MMKTTTTLLAISSLLIAGVVYSHSGAMGVVKERMDAMQDMGDKTKVVADMFKGKADFERAALIEAADVFVMHGSEMTELFPDTKKSRTGSNTEALPKIWEQWDDFDTLVNQFITRSEALQKTLSSTDDMRELKKAFFQTTKSCSSCHKGYRKPKE
jgi:cytochrome c556